MNNEIIMIFSRRFLPFEWRVDEVLKWLDLPEDERPDLINLYFVQPDASGHAYGPDSEEVVLLYNPCLSLLYFDCFIPSCLSKNRSITSHFRAQCDNCKVSASRFTSLVRDRCGNDLKVRSLDLLLRKVIWVVKLLSGEWQRTPQMRSQYWCR